MQKKNYDKNNLNVGVLLKGDSKDKKGITLIALIITIIVMLILVTVAVNVAVNSNLFGHARNAAKEWKAAEESEMNINMDISKYTQAGEKVELKTGWNADSVYAVNDGQGNTIPVPKGFYYVGGNLNTGVVISDDVADEGKYRSGTVPSGIEPKVENGIVSINYTLQGNQFVWIPCTESEYHKTDFEMENCDMTTGDEELAQVKQYGGFYVGRFEAGLASIIDEFTTDITNNTETAYNTTGIPQSKAGQIPWVMINWTNSKANAESMYNTESVKSGLITGTQWDVMITRINKMDTSKSLSDSNTWGNHANTTPKINIGRIANGYITTSDYWIFKPYEEIKYSQGMLVTNKLEGETQKNGYVWTTGASDETKAYNLYDVAGNVWEWTDEWVPEQISEYAGNPVNRGGGCVQASDISSAYTRNKVPKVNTKFFDLGFRVILYIK